MARDAQWMVAQDTFAGDLESGAAFTVLKGQHYLSTDEVVKLDAGRGVLFLPLDVGEDKEPEPPSKSEPSKAEAPAPVKAAAKAAGRTGKGAS